MLYNFFNILTMAVLLGAAIFFVAALIFLAVIYFLKVDLDTQLFIIFMAVLLLSMGFQIVDKIVSYVKKQETEQYKIDN